VTGTGSDYEYVRSRIEEGRWPELPLDAVMAAADGHKNYAQALTDGAQTSSGYAYKFSHALEGLTGDAQSDNVTAFIKGLIDEAGAHEDAARGLYEAGHQVQYLQTRLGEITVDAFDAYVAAGGPGFGEVALPVYEYQADQAVHNAVNKVDDALKNKFTLPPGVGVILPGGHGSGPLTNPA
jgi:hypothetical protein